MMNREKLIQKLRDKAYRKEFVSDHIDIGVPFQIRALRRQRHMDQKDLAASTGMAQPRISLVERPGNGRLALTTLKRLASAFDVALIVRFVPFSELVSWVTNLSEEHLAVPSFEEDSGLRQPSVQVAGTPANLIESEPILTTFSTGAVLAFPFLRYARVSRNGTEPYIREVWPQAPSPKVKFSIVTSMTIPSARAYRQSVLDEIATATVGE